MLASGGSERILQDLGNRLRELRKCRNLRQLDMESFGLSYKYYQRLESGQVNPTLVTLQKLAAAFGISVYDLFLELALEVPDAMAEAAREQRQLLGAEKEHQHPEHEERLPDAERHEGERGCHVAHLISTFAIVCFCMFEVPS
jgi:transcriptional regulator with XRE-family HTH domain